MLNKFGLNVKQRHYNSLLTKNYELGLIEVHAENLFSKSNMEFQQISKNYNVSLHGVGLSLGSIDGVNENHLAKLRELNDLYQPKFISEHIAWSEVDNIFVNDLLPLPYNQESLAVIVDNIKYVQDYLGRQILIENPSSYLKFKSSNMHEFDFINQIISQSNCGLLFDINNMYVSCKNNNWSITEYIANINKDAIQEIHLAGHSQKKINNKILRLDTHNCEVSEQVLAIYYEYFANLNNIYTVLEWDSNTPSFKQLHNYLKKIAINNNIDKFKWPTALVS